MGAAQSNHIGIEIILGSIRCSHNVCIHLARSGHDLDGLFYCQENYQIKYSHKRNPAGSGVTPAYNKNHENRDCTHKIKPFQHRWKKCMLCDNPQHTTVKPCRNDAKTRNAGELIGTCKAGRDANCFIYEQI